MEEGHGGVFYSLPQIQVRVCKMCGRCEVADEDRVEMKEGQVSVFAATCREHVTRNHPPG